MNTIKEEIKESLDTLINRAKSIRSAVNDCDEVCLKNINASLECLDKTISHILQNQKRRGKKFISNQDIDNIFANL